MLTNEELKNIRQRAARSRQDVPTLLAHIDTIEPELDKLRALRQRVDEAEIALLSDNNQLVPAKVLQAWFEYIWQGVTPPTEDAD